MHAKPNPPAEREYRKNTGRKRHCFKIRTLSSISVTTWHHNTGRRERTRELQDTRNAKQDKALRGKKKKGGNKCQTKSRQEWTLTAQRIVTFSKPLKPCFSQPEKHSPLLCGKRQFCQWFGVQEGSQWSHIRDLSDMLNKDVTYIRGFTHRDLYYPFAFPLLHEPSYTSTNPSLCYSQCH